MTNEQKQLLFIDLCGRLPYGVKILDIPANVVGKLFLVSTTDMVEYEPADEANDDNWNQTLYNIKPYLRPMTSMTEKEEDEYMIARQKDIAEAYIHATPQNAIDWLNKKMFDYRGLIEKGLALEATEDMYKED